MAPARRYASQAVNNDLDLSLLSLLHDSLEALISAKHLVGSFSAGDGERRRILPLVLNLPLALVVVGVVVSLEDAHHVEGGDASLLERVDGLLNFGEISPFNELALFCIYFCVLIVDLDLMEDLVADTLGMDYVAPLGQRAKVVVQGLRIVVGGALWCGGIKRVADLS